MYRVGNVPRRDDSGDFFVHSFTRKGFFGPYANLYKTRNPGEPIRWDKGLGPAAIDLSQTTPSDMERPDGLPMPLLTNGDVTVHVSRRRTAGDGPRREADTRTLNFNIDVKRRLRLTKEAERYVQESQPAAAATA